MQKTSKKTRFALDKTRNTCYNTSMKNKENKMTNTTMTYREWLIDRNEGLTRADKKRAARAYMVKENEIMAAKKAAKNFTK